MVHIVRAHTSHVYEDSDSQEGAFYFAEGDQNFRAISILDTADVGHGLLTH